MRMLPSANPSRYQRRDPPVVTTCIYARCRSVRKPGPRPMSTRSCPASTMDAMIGQPSGHRLPRRIRPDPVPSTRHASRTGSDADRGTDERHGRHSDILDRHDHEDGPPGHAEPLLWGRRLRLGKPRLARRWQHCQRDRNHGSDQAVTWCRSTVQAAPRRTALLGKMVWGESRANGEASSVMATGEREQRLLACWAWAKGGRR